MKSNEKNTDDGIPDGILKGQYPHPHLSVKDFA